jgi:hypothetical protein
MYKVTYQAKTEIVEEVIRLVPGNFLVRLLTVNLHFVIRLVVDLGGCSQLCCNGLGRITKPNFSLKIYLRMFRIQRFRGMREELESQAKSARRRWVPEDLALLAVDRTPEHRGRDRWDWRLRRVAPVIDNHPRKNGGGFTRKAERPKSMTVVGLELRINWKVEAQSTKV